MADIKLFGLTIDKDGAVRAMREVGEKSAQMARDGAKNAQLYADAFRDRLNAVAYRYIPETMRAIDALAARHRALATSGVPGLLSDAEIAKSAAAYDAMIQKMKGVEEASGGTVTGIGRVRQGLTSLVAQVTGTMPVLDRMIGVLGSFWPGNAVMIGVLAGLAAVGLAYRALTRDARDATEAQDAALKKLEEWDRKRHLGAGGEFGAQVEGAGGALAREATKQGFATSLSSAGGVAGGIGALYGLFATQTQKQFAASVQAVHDGREALGAETTKLMLEQRDKQATMLADAIKNGNATAAQRKQALQMLKEDTALAAQYAKAGLLEQQTAAGNQAQTLSEALFPKKDQRDADRLAAEIQREKDAAANAQNKRNIAAVESIAHMKAENDAIREQIAARRDSTDATEAATIASAGNLAVAQLAPDVSAKLVAGVRAEAEEHARLTIQLKNEQDARKAADEAAKKVAADAEMAARRQLQEVDRLLKSTFQSLFTSIFTSGKSIFQSLFDAIKAGFIKLVSDLAAARLAEKIAGSALGGILGSLVPGVAGAQGAGGIGATNYLNGLGAQTAVSVGASAAGGGLAGYGVGASLYSSSRGAGANNTVGALGGAASGAAMGAMLGSVVPGIGTAVGAIVGGAAGFIGGVLGMGSASKAAAKAMADAVKQVTLSMQDLKARATGNSLDQQIAAVEADREKQRQMIEDAWSGGGAGSDRVIWRTQQLKQMNAYEDQIIANLRDAAAQQKQQAAEDLQVRLLAAQGHTKEADALRLQLAQQREYEEAVKAGTDPATLALLQQVQAQEKLAAATNAATTSALNMVEGYKLQAEVYRVMASGPQTSSMASYGGAAYSGPIRAPVGAAKGTPQSTDPAVLQPVQFVVDGRVFAEGMLKQYGAGQTGGNLKVAFGDLVQKVMPA